MAGMAMWVGVVHGAFRLGSAGTLCRGKVCSSELSSGLAGVVRFVSLG